MHMFHDPDEWIAVVDSKPCTACDGDMRRCHGACNGSVSYSMVRRDAAEVLKIKIDRARAEEDAILRKADAIRAARKSA